VLRATLKSLLARKLRLALSALAVVLGVAFVAGTLVLTDTLGRTFDDLFAEVDRNTSVAVRSVAAYGGSAGDRGSGRPVPASLLAPVRRVDGVAEAVGTVTGYAQLVDPAERDVISRGFAPGIGLGWTGSSVLSPLRLAAGRPPGGAAEIAVDRDTADGSRLRLGQPVVVLTQQGPRAVTVVGIVTFGSASSLAGATLTVFDLGTAQRLLLPEPERFTAVKVAAAPGVSQEVLRDRIARVLPPGTEAVTGRQLIRENADAVAEGLSGFSRFLLAFAVVSLFVGSFLIFNTFTMLLAQRVQELALLRALGASRRQVRTSVLVEAVAVGVVGATAGLGLGVLAAVGLKSVLGVFGVEIPAGPVVFRPRTAVWAYLIGVLVTAAAAFLPARRAGTVPPIAALRDVAVDPTRGLRRRAVIGAAVLLGGVTVLVLGLRTTGSSALNWVGLGAGLAFLGVATLSPFLSRPVVRVLGAPFVRLLGTAGTLGRENAQRNPRRTSATAAALMIGIALVAAFSVVGASLKKSVEEVVGGSLTAEYIVTPKGLGGAGFSPRVAAGLREVPGVAAASELRFAAARIAGEEAFVQAIDPANLTDVLNLELSRGEPALSPGAFLAARETAEANGWSVGQQVPVEFRETGQRRLRLAGTYEDNELAGDYLISLATYEANVSERLDSIVLVSTRDGSDLAAVRAGIDRVLAPYPNLRVQDQAEYVREAGDRIDQLLGLVTVLLGLAIVIAVAGIVNTLALSVIERTHEIGLLRAVGMSRRQLRRMVRVEAVVIAVYGAVLGVAIGSGLGWALVRALGREGFGAFAYPVGQLLLYVLVAGLAGVLAAVWPARRAARLDVLRAIAAT
jgi:putative ABC transport system permease protein